MKKFIILLGTLLLAVTLNAQVYVGGNLGLSFSRDVSTPTMSIESRNYFSVAPEVGYSFNKYFTLGTNVQYQWNKGNTHSFSVSPFARCTFAQWEHFGLFIDALFEYRTYAVSQTGSRHNTWQAGLAPGFKIPITPKCGLTTRIAFLGWKKVGDEVVFFPSVNFINSATVGFYYNL